MATRDHRSSTPTVSAAPGAGSGALVRLGWMMGGPLMMLIAGFTMVHYRRYAVGLMVVATTGRALAQAVHL